MIFNLLFAVLGTYVFFKNGMGYMLRARIAGSEKADRCGYAMVMIAGTILGDFLGISLAYHYASESVWLQACCGTLCSIVMGETFYFYNKKWISKIPAVHERKNF